MVGMKLTLLVIIISASVVSASVIWYYSEADNSNQLDDDDLSETSGDLNDETPEETDNSTDSNPDTNSTIEEEYENNNTDENPVVPPLNYTGYFTINFTELQTERGNSEFVNGWWYQGIESENNLSFITNWTEWNLTFLKVNNSQYTSDDFVPDFINYTYAMYYWGEKSTWSYYVNLDSLIYDNGTLRFSYNFTTPGSMDYSTISHPNSFVKIPKSELNGYGISELVYPPY